VNDSEKERDMFFLQLLPKADLHTHLGGVLTAQEIIETAKVHPRPDALVKEILSYDNKPEEFDTHIFGKNIYREQFYGIGINPYQRLGDYQGSKLLQTKETIAKAAELYACKLLDDNVKYVEIRCSPHKYTKEGLEIDDVVNTLMDTLDKFNNIEYRLICIIGRQGGYTEITQSISDILQLISRNKRFADKLCGIDLAGDESANSPKKLREQFMPFFEKCINITIHAGETESVENIWQAVYHLSADRIGNGLKLLDRPEFLKHFIDKNIGVEMCPSSNRQIVGYGKSGDTSYPLREYMKRGLKVTVNTDNQGISRTSLSNEFYEAARLCGALSLWDCFVLIRNSLIVSFADKETKMKLLRRFESEIFELSNNTIKE
jgi:adenosine deaminase